MTVEFYKLLDVIYAPPLQAPHNAKRNIKLINRSSSRGKQFFYQLHNFIYKVLYSFQFSHVQLYFIYNEASTKIFIMSETTTMGEREQIGENIDRLIAKSGLTKREVAKKLGLRETTVGEYTRGKVIPSTQVVIKLCLILNCKYEDILGKPR